jgi:HSP20 family protein
MTQLVKFTPFRELERFFDEDVFLPVFPRLHAPALDLYETEDEVVAEVSIPGMDPKQVSVEIENNMLHIHADKTEESEDTGRGYYRKEVRRGTFSRSIALPMEVDTDNVTATSENGIMRIVMPKSEKAKPKKVAVEVK